MQPIAADAAWSVCVSVGPWKTAELMEVSFVVCMVLVKCGRL